MGLLVMAMGASVWNQLNPCYAINGLRIIGEFVWIGLD